MKIVETDNGGGDYPDEKFVNLPTMPAARCEAIAILVNDFCCCDSAHGRYWKVVADDYKLAPGFEP